MSTPVSHRSRCAKLMCCCLGDEASPTNLLFNAFILFEVLVIVLYALGTEYGVDLRPQRAGNTSHVNDLYPLFQDVQVMIFVGFGFLMTFLHRHVFTALGLTFLLGAMSIQWGILTTGFFAQVVADEEFHRIELDISSLIKGNYAAGAVLISFGAVLGKLTPVQILAMGVLELIPYAINEAILVEKLHVADIGGSLIIHTFGAFFGVAVGYLTSPRLGSEPLKHEKSIYLTDSFAMVGTLFLWVYWPSFNAALAGDVGNARARTVLNTSLSLTGSCIAAFLFSRKFRDHKKFDMVDIQNATLAGGVAIGAAANMMVYPFGALTVGFLAGALSTLCFARLKDALARKAGFGFDTCGVFNLHGLPGALAGLVAAFFAFLADGDDYGVSLAAVFPERGEGRSAGRQALFQLIGLGVTIAMALVSGIVVGFILRLMPKVREGLHYNDREYWEMPAVRDTDMTVHALLARPSSPSIQTTRVF